MGDFALALLATSLFKIALIVSGTASIFIGYQLFCRGITGGSSNVEGKIKDYSLIMSSLAPGTCFALFGTVLVGITAYAGMQVKLPEGTVTSKVGYSASPSKAPSGEGYKVLEISNRRHDPGLLNF